MINEPIKHDKNYPPSASAEGHNAYYLKGCEAVQRSPSYASCLWKITEIEAGRETVQINDCTTACRQGKCLAQGMRDQERLQGVALFYFPRQSPNALHLSVKVAGDFGVRITNLTDPALVPKPPPTERERAQRSVPKPQSPIDALDREMAAAENGYAAAITAAVAELAPPAAPQPKPAPPPAPAPQPKPVAGRPVMEPGETPLQYARRLAASRTAAQPQQGTV